MKLKKSFTLSEIMIAMTVLGIIVAACVPIILNMTPNKNAIMLKKAYYTTVEVVNDLINDPVYYPDEDGNGNPINLSYAPAEGTIIPGSNVSLNNQNRRFRCLFVSKLNVPLDSLPNWCNINVAGGAIMPTPDGLTWNFNLCPYNGAWAEAGVCRIDVSVGNPGLGTYSAIDDMEYCSSEGIGWHNACTAATISNRLNTVNKAAFFIYPDGTITLSGTANTSGFSNGQPLIQSVIDGSASLLGKSVVTDASTGNGGNGNGGGNQPGTGGEQPGIGNDNKDKVNNNTATGNEEH